jgi:hypothetical protein
MKGINQTMDKNRKFCIDEMAELLKAKKEECTCQHGE